MNDTLIIENVDLEKLEDQRHALQRTINRLDSLDEKQRWEEARITEKDYALLQGLENMLDDWSDARYHAAKEEKE